jgi:hypothetical protein
MRSANSLDKYSGHSRSPQAHLDTGEFPAREPSLRVRMRTHAERYSMKTTGIFFTKPKKDISDITHKRNPLSNSFMDSTNTIDWQS